VTGGVWLAAGSALWLGLVTSISPCPLATNVAAVSYLGSRLSQPRRVLIAGFLYTGGRALAYAALGAIAVWGLVSLVSVSAFLQGTFFKLLGPGLILVGMAVLGLLPVPSLNVGSGPADALRRRFDGGGLWTVPLLGAVFALSFCPVSAALFFGSLIPLAVEQRSPFVLPVLYGVGTGLPVALVALLVALGAARLGSAVNRLQSFERWARPVTGVILIVVGIYETLRAVFGVL